MINEDGTETWNHFELSEFDCKCGCGENKMSSDLIDELDQMRGRLGFALVVTSGYRCPTHNQAVSTTGPDGPHTTGRAVDFAIMGNKAHALIREALYRHVFSGIGVMQRGTHTKRFIHLDNLQLENKRPNIWSY